MQPGRFDTQAFITEMCLQLIYLCNNCTWKIDTQPLFCISTPMPSTVPAAISGWELSSLLQCVLCDSEQGKRFLRGQGQEDTRPRAVLPMLPGAHFSVCFFHLRPFFCIDGEMKKHSLGYQRDTAEHLFSETKEEGCCCPAKDSKPADQICKEVT